MAPAVLTPSASWTETWLSALVSPSLANYQRIANDPDANTRHAYYWIIRSVMIVTLIFLVLAVARVQVYLTPFRGLARGGGSFPVSLGCGLPIAIVVGVIAFTIEVALLNFFAGLMGAERKDKDERLTYLMAAIQSPMAFLYLIFFLLPPHPVLTIGAIVLSLYHLYLIGLALRAVYKLSWPRATIVVLLNLTVVTSVIFLFTLLFPR